MSGLRGADVAKTILGLMGVPAAEVDGTDQSKFR
jgi:hypothetical protein